MLFKNLTQYSNHILYTFFALNWVSMCVLAVHCKMLYFKNKELVVLSTERESLLIAITKLKIAANKAAELAKNSESPVLVAKSFEFSNTKMIAASIFFVFGIALYYYIYSPAIVLIPIRIISKMDSFGNEIVVGISKTPQYFGIDIIPCGAQKIGLSAFIKGLEQTTKNDFSSTTLAPVLSSDGYSLSAIINWVSSFF